MSVELILVFGLGAVFVGIIVLVERYGSNDLKTDKDPKKRADGGGVFGFLGGDGGGSDGGGGGGDGGGGAG